MSEDCYSSWNLERETRDFAKTYPEIQERQNYNLNLWKQLPRKTRKKRLSEYTSADEYYPGSLAFSGLILDRGSQKARDILSDHIGFRLLKLEVNYSPKDKIEVQCGIYEKPIASVLNGFESNDFIGAKLVNFIDRFESSKTVYFYTLYNTQTKTFRLVGLRVQIGGYETFEDEVIPLLKQKYGMPIKFDRNKRSGNQDLLWITKDGKLIITRESCNDRYPYDRSKDSVVVFPYMYCLRYESLGHGVLALQDRLFAERKLLEFFKSESESKPTKKLNANDL